jgi:hypothetical protein
VIVQLLSCVIGVLITTGIVGGVLSWLANYDQDVINRRVALHPIVHVTIQFGCYGVMVLALYGMVTATRALVTLI